MHLELVLLSLLSIAATEREVTANGEAAVLDNDVAAAKERATDAALRNAVEQTVGTLVQSESLAENNVLLNDTVYTQARGFVKNFSVTGVKNEGNAVTVTVKASVVEDKVEDALVGAGVLLARLGKPRVVVLVSEQNIGDSQAGLNIGPVSTELGVTENTIMEKLRETGFSFVDPQALTGKIKVENAVALVNGNQPNAIRELADASGADVIIVGKAVSKDQGTIMGTQMHSGQANLTLRVFNSGNGAILANSTCQGAEAHVDTTTAGTKALKKAAEKCVKELSAQLLKEWQKAVFGAKTVAMKVRGVGKYQALGKFKNELLARVRGIQSVQERRFEKGEASIDIELKGTVQMLAQEIAAKQLAEVTGTTASSLEVQLASAK